MSWATAVGTFAGAAIGAAATFVSQAHSMRTAERRERRAREDRHREQRREAVDAFLQAAQEVDRVASHQTDRPPEFVHELWLRYHRLAVVGSDQLQRPLKEFADCLNATYWEGPPSGKAVWEHLRDSRVRFNVAARAELAMA